MNERPESAGTRWPFILGAAVGVCLTAIVAAIIIWSPWSGDGGDAEAVQDDASTSTAPTPLLAGEAEAATLEYIYSEPSSGVINSSRPSRVVGRWVKRGFEMTCSAEDQDSGRWIVECSAANTTFNRRAEGYQTRTIDQWGIFEVAPDGEVIELTVYCEDWSNESVICP